MIFCVCLFVPRKRGLITVKQHYRLKRPTSAYSGTALRFCVCVCLYSRARTQAHRLHMFAMRLCDMCSCLKVLPLLNNGMVQLLVTSERLTFDYKYRSSAPCGSGFRLTTSKNIKSRKILQARLNIASSNGFI